MKKKIDKTSKVNNKRVKTAASIYFIVLALSLSATSVFGLKLYNGIGLIRLPSNWLYCLCFILYGAPLLAAFIGSCRQKLFWKTFFRIIVIVLIVDICYSGFAFFLRRHQEKKWKELKKASRNINIHSVYHEMIDENFCSFFERNAFNNIRIIRS